MNITVIGLGYIGLPTACLLAKAGNNVKGYDVDERKLALLKKGKTPFDEHGMQDLLDAVRTKKTFSVTSTLRASDVFLIAVPTPDIDHKADLKFVFQAIKAVGEVLKDGNLVIVESTISPRASIDELIPLLEKTSKKFLFAHCPERAIPGSTLHEMVHNDRIVGGFTPEASQVTAKLYKSFVKGKVYETDVTTAECCKVMENTFRDVNIALANEFCKISEELGIDVWEAISLANKHPRVNIHSPGPGVGGHCIPVDPWFFVGISKQAKLIHTARDTNDGMPSYVVKRVMQLCKKHHITRPTVAVLGVSYKKNVDDARETPATYVIEALQKAGALVVATDPHVTRFSSPIIPLDEALKKADVALLVTDHDEYVKVKFDRYENLKFVYDTRNILAKQSHKLPIYTLGVRAEH